MAYKTVEQKRASCKRYYEKYKARELARLKPQVYNRRRRLRQMIDEHKALLGCRDCGNKNPVVLDLHHHNDDKIMGVAEMISKGLAEYKIKEEINKCIVLCSNCHRIEHHKKRKYTEK